MNIAVGFGCLVVFGLLMEANGFTEQQQLMEPQRELYKGCKTMSRCKKLGGVCQTTKIDCKGSMHTLKSFCYGKECGCCVPPPKPDVTTTMPPLPATKDVTTTMPPLPATMEFCIFGEKGYSNGAFIEDTCMVLQCIDGAWNYTGRMQQYCELDGQCRVFGEPHFTPYDLPNAEQYDFDGSGTYVVTQPGLNIYAEFGVNMNFVKCYWKGNWFTCVRLVNYYEPGIEIEVILAARDLLEPCTDHPYEPQCAMKVFVNGQQRLIDNTVSLFYATDGTVLVFEHNHAANDNKNLICINIVGSKGFSVSVCKQSDGFPWTYVWAMPYLKDKLFGLCDKYTGRPHENYTMQNGTTTTNSTIFAPTWKIGDFCRCELKFTYPLKGCVISFAANDNTACKCELQEDFCSSTIVPCFNSESPFCKNPDTTIESCQQATGGNCQGYDIPS